MTTDPPASPTTEADLIGRCIARYGVESAPAVTELVAALAAAREQIAVLQRFKDWVHAYLDNKGVPKEVQDSHLAAGCRIGGRLDWVFGQIAAKDAEIERLKAACEMVLKRWTFDNDQQHTHNWHDRTDCTEAIRAALSRT